MDIQWRPPTNDPAECNFLEDNYITCLKEKAQRDQVDVMKCKVENLIWFNLECPERHADYTDPIKFRKIFTLLKQGKKLDRPDYVRL